jgi:hypothetical protein
MRAKGSSGSAGSLFRAVKRELTEQPRGRDLAARGLVGAGDNRAARVNAKPTSADEALSSALPEIRSTDLKPSFAPVSRVQGWLECIATAFHVPPLLTRVIV